MTEMKEQILEEFSKEGEAVFALVSLIRSIKHNTRSEFCEAEWIRFRRELQRCFKRDAERSAG